VKTIIAIDSFKGCLSSAQANEAAAGGLKAEFPDSTLIQIPVSDGGEGWLEAFCAANVGNEVVIDAHDPLMLPVRASYLRDGDTAIIESARAVGLNLMRGQGLNPLIATSYGLGEIVADAVRRGCRKIIVGLGGSATSDCGKGMLRALIDCFAPGGTWKDVQALKDVSFTIAADVDNPLCGTNGAARVFAPQKGANPEMVEALEENALRFAEESAALLGHDCSDMAGAGAAGGLGYAFMQYLGAGCRPGADILLDAIGFDALLEGAGLVITGEGSADRQTLMGKLPFRILQRASARQIPVCLLAGRTNDRRQLLEAGFSYVENINPEAIPLGQAMEPETAKANIAGTVRRIARIL